ncbi:hypothetical protein DFQ28_009288 [Apophysomyces sp. BC1034]|nr:hypothetical protein DFQ29_008976 [Apophysomyces sp. BC1021]KAG0185461.1 hypothetical protein DFQ28_009288 [Apophysomyces sp. BC1034]
MESALSPTDEIPNRGVEAWLARREAWTQKPQSRPETNGESSTTGMNRAWLESSTKETQLALFKALVVDRRKLSQPLPLEFVVKIIVQGWQNDGTWPEGLVPPQSSDDNQ